MEGAYNGRIVALLDTLRHEIEGTAAEGQSYKLQRDEYERKFEAHVQELNILHFALSELERAHVHMTHQYEAEIVSLRRQIEAAGGIVQQSQLPSSSTLQQAGGAAAAAVTSSFLLGGADTNVLGMQHTPATSAFPQGMLPMGLAGFPGIVRGASSSSGGDTAMPDAAAGLLAQLSSNGGRASSNSNVFAAGAAALLVAASSRGALAGSGEQNLKPVDGGGKPMDDWNIVMSPTCSQKVHLKLEHVLQHDSVVCCVRFSGDGKYFASGCNKTAALFDVQTGRRVCMFVNDQVVETDEALEKATGGGADSYVRSVCFDPDSTLLVAGTEDKTIKIWDLRTRRLKLSLRAHTKDIYSVDCSADRRHIASGSGDKTAKLWDINSGICVRTFGNDDGPKDGVTSVAVSPNGKYLAAGSLDKDVRIWDCETGQLVETFDGHSDSVYSVSFSPDGTLLATGSLDQTVRLWDTSNVGKRSGNKCKFTFKGHKDFVLSVAFAPLGTWLISGSKDRSVQFWDPRMLREKSKSDGTGPSVILQGHQNSVISLAHSPVTKLFATGSGDKCARIWRYKSEP